MREILLLFLVVMTGLQASGQELRKMRLVGDASKSDSEIVTRRDPNGNLTAGIMVISDMDGFSYDSYDGVVGSVDHRPGMDIVYLSTNERVLEIYKSGYQPLKIILSEVGIRLKPQEVWQIKVAGDALPASAIPVTIRITPADATLTINGKTAIGTTHSLNPGSHTLKIEKEGFKTEEKTITVSEQQVFFEFALTRQPDAGLQIETTPAGATVYLDGVNLGTTPLAVFYKPGTYPIRIVKEGYVTLENQTLEVALPQTRKSYTLEENVGYLTINTHSGASVYFNDQLIANPKNVKLPPQLVKVKVTQPKAEPLEQQVVLKRNDRLTFDMFPVVQTGTIQIAVTPFDAQIEITGDAGEKYTATGMKVFEDIPVGRYILKVSANGFTKTEKAIQLNINEVLKETINLEGSSDFDLDIEMVFVKGGTFKMGCTNEMESLCKDDEKPTHLVMVGDFYIGKFEVTQKQWRAVMGTDPPELRFKGCDDCPVENVSWYDIHEFVTRLNHKTGKKYRLPTEAEWEFAARGGIQSKGFNYAGSNSIREIAWYDSNSSKKTQLIGGKKPNELGVYDMSGNVWEWCEDDWHDNYTGAPKNGQAWVDSPRGTSRVLRGGSWFNIIFHCSVYLRLKLDPVDRGGDGGFGFRLAHSVD